jgi:hypothetical protein
MKFVSASKSGLRAALAVVLIAPLVVGCGESTKRALGWEKAPPDEFSVVTRAPLTQPPDYDLRPPAPGTSRPQQTSTVATAKKVLIGPDSMTPAPVRAASASDNPDLAALSSGESALLKKAGATTAMPDVRRQVDEETTALVKESSSFTDDLLFWQTKPPPGEVVDPAKESQRLESNASLGKTATEGDTPQIVRRQKGWLEGIF